MKEEIDSSAVQTAVQTETAQEASAPIDVTERLERIERIILMGSKEVLDTEDLAIYIKRSPARIRTLVSKREIPHYKNDRGHVHFRKAEIDEWLLGRKVHTNDELDTKGKQYWSKKRVAAL